MNDKPFGKFKFDKTYEVYKTFVSHRNHDLKISIRVDDEYTLADALPIAEDFWKQRGKWFKTAREQACSELLETINSRIEDLPELNQISKTAFSKSLAVPDEIQLESTLIKNGSNCPITQICTASTS